MSDIETKKKYVRPVIKLIELARNQTESGRRPFFQAQPAPTSASNVTGGTVIGG